MGLKQFLDGSEFINDLKHLRIFTSHEGERGFLSYVVYDSILISLVLVLAFAHVVIFSLAFDAESTLGFARGIPVHALVLTIQLKLLKNLKL